MFVASGWAGRRAPAWVSRSEARRLPDADAAVVRGLGDWLGEVTGEARRGGGMVDEYRVFVAPWGFAADEVVGARMSIKGPSTRWCRRAGLVSSRRCSPT